ncbi:MAG: hypothetical protein WCQ66_10720, partial [Sphaerochaetaceae bacterium]
SLINCQKALAHQLGVLSVPKQNSQNTRNMSRGMNPFFLQFPHLQRQEIACALCNQEKEQSFPKMAALKKLQMMKPIFQVHLYMHGRQNSNW